MVTQGWQLTTDHGHSRDGTQVQETQASQRKVWKMRFNSDSFNQKLSVV